MQVFLQLLASIFSILVGLVSFRFKSISTSGLIALLLLSHLFIYMNMLIPLCIIFLMFASSTIITKYKKGLKKEFYLVNEKNGPRDYIQALANLGASTVCIIAFVLFNNDLYLVAFLCSVATANADSWATEIGGLSLQKPVLLSNFKTVPKGVSGGVTRLGILGGFLGSLFIVAAYYWLNQHYANTHLPFKLYWVSILSGFLGMILDSLLGSKFQVLYQSSKGQLVEYNAPSNKQVKGIKWINNDLINAISTSLAAIFGIILYNLV